jgi:hypothetical protein
MDDDELLARDDKRIRKSLAQHFMENPLPVRNMIYNAAATAITSCPLCHLYKRVSLNRPPFMLAF